MRYKCLVLDHDDTLVNSTATIHFPCFCEFLKEVRPNAKAYTLEDYFRKNFDPGILPFFTEEVGLSPQELDYEFRFWQNYVKPRVPQAFSGMREILERHKRQGGILAVVSHSMKDAIVRDYRENGLPQPDVIYGWDLPPEQRKPAPWALEQIMAQFSLPASELLMVDDLKPGYDMARAAGVDFAAAGWAYDVPEIEAFMRKNCDFYFKTVQEFRTFLFTGCFQIATGRFIKFPSRWT